MVWNNPPFSGTDLQIEEKAKDFFEDMIDKGDLKYMSFQLERGETNGTLHIQGYFQWARKQRKSAGRRAFPGAHLEIRQGDHEAARKYTEKNEGKPGDRVEGCHYFELGEPNREGSGRRTDLEDVISTIRQLFPAHIAVCA